MPRLLAMTPVPITAAIEAFIVGNGVLIGFSWEQTFERSVSTIASTFAQVSVPLLKLFLAAILMLMVLPAWRIWVVRRALECKPREGVAGGGGH